MNLLDYKVIDLTHHLNTSTPTWHGGCGFKTRLRLDYPKARVQEFELIASAGTHVDAPSHFIKGAKDLDQFSVEDFIKPCFVIDVSEKVNAFYKITLEDIRQFEAQVANINADSIVLFHTGWAAYFKDARAYRNEINGKCQYPILAAEVADYLLQKGVAGIGVDTLSPDLQDYDFPIHLKMLGAGRLIYENLNNLNRLPKTGAFLLALPLKIEGAAESPVRAVGLFKD